MRENFRIIRDLEANNFTKLTKEDELKKTALKQTKNYPTLKKNVYIIMKRNCIW